MVSILPGHIRNFTFERHGDIYLVIYLYQSAAISSNYIYFKNSSDVEYSLEEYELSRRYIKAYNHKDIFNFMLSHNVKYIGRR